MSTRYLSADELRGIADLLDRMNHTDLESRGVMVSGRVPVETTEDDRPVGWMVEPDGDGWLFEITEPVT